MTKILLMSFFSPIFFRGEGIAYRSIISATPSGEWPICSLRSSNPFCFQFVLLSSPSSEEIPTLLFSLTMRIPFIFQFSHSVMSDSETPRTAACQASLSITNFQSLLKLLSLNYPHPGWHASSFFRWITLARGGPALALGISCSFPSNSHEEVSLILRPSFGYPSSWSMKSWITNQSSETESTEQRLKAPTEASKKWNKRGRMILMGRGGTAIFNDWMHIHAALNKWFSDLKMPWW